MLKNSPIMLCSNALKCFNYASKNCYYAHIMLAAASLSPLRLTSGLENLLLHYVSLDPGRGVMICPTHATPPGAVHSELLLCFQRTAVAVREVLVGRVGGSEGVEDEEESEGSEWGSEEEEKEEEEKVGDYKSGRNSITARLLSFLFKVLGGCVPYTQHSAVCILSFVFKVLGGCVPYTHT